MNLENYRDKKKSYKVLNSIVKYKNKGKIVRGIKSEDEIIYGDLTNKAIKKHYEKIFPIKWSNSKKRE